jgi:hypothetical protein
MMVLSYVAHLDMVTILMTDLSRLEPTSIIYLSPWEERVVRHDQQSLNVDEAVKGLKHFSRQPVWRPMVLAYKCVGIIPSSIDHCIVPYPCHIIMKTAIGHGKGHSW